MEETKVRIFASIDDFAILAEEIMEGKLSPLCMHIDIIEEPLHVVYYYEEDGETIEFYQRHFCEKYDEPDFSLDIESIDDLDDLPEEIYAIASLYYTFAHNINMIINDMGIYERVLEDEQLQQVGGIFVTCDEEGLVTCTNVYDKERPFLACFSPDGDIEDTRPYEDEIAENMSFIFESIDIKKQRAEEGSIRDMRDLAFRYLCGMDNEPDYKQAMVYAKKLIKHQDAFGSFVAAVLYCQGYGVRKNYAKAIDLIAPYEDNSYCDDLLDIIENMDLNFVMSKENTDYLLEYMHQLLDLNLFLEKEMDMPFESKELIKRSKEMIKKNIPEGYFYLGRTLEEEGQVKKAIEYYKEGYNNDEPQCIAKLAYLYLDGIGVRRSKKKAISLFKQAGELGFYEAYRFLGELYMENRMIEESIESYKQYLEYSEDPYIQDIVDEFSDNKKLVN